MYIISKCKDKAIEEVGHWEDSVWLWHLSWRRPRLVWEAAMEEQLFLVIAGPHLSLGRPDTCKWRGHEDEIFSVRSTYNKVQVTFEEEESKEFNMLWNTRVTPKTQLLRWRLFLDKLSTKVNLLARVV